MTCVMLLLSAAMAVGMVQSTDLFEAGGHVEAALSVVDPNTAPWWELTVLPRIGETTARAIVRYREHKAEGVSTSVEGRAFREPADLDAVPRIGIKTIERMAPFLTFDQRRGR